jgi:DNA-binding transcriptional LysR family regulator
MLNIHHLELFYYVARHGGISEAVRNIPYGIQQPAVSVQIIQLEETLGTKLFNRRPFQLTAEGTKLYQFIEPFFSNLDRVANEITGRATQFIRLGASNTILRNHFPELIRFVCQKVPGLKFSLHDGIEPQLNQWLEKNEIDLAVTILQSKPPAGLNSFPLLKLPLVLLVPTSSKIKSPAELWKRDKIEEPLICLPPGESITRNFQQRLGKMGVDWFGTIVVNALDLVETYAANGFGIGLSVIVPGAKLTPGLRRLPLDDFDPIVLGAVWTGKASPVVQTFLDVFKKRAEELASSPENVGKEFATAFGVKAPAPQAKAS